MNSRTFILKETLFLLLGELLCSAIIIGIYALIGVLKPSVIWGLLIGSVVSAANFFLMGVGADAAADKAVSQNVKGGKNTIRLSYQLRLIGMFVILFACAKSGLFDPLAMVLPIAFARPILMIVEFLRKPGDTQQ